MKLFSVLLILLFSTAATADNVTEMSDSLCKKVKACGMEQIQQQQIPPEMEQMMVAMFDGMCATMVSPYLNRSFDAGLEEKAVACLEAVEELSCPELMEGKGDRVPACKEYKEAAEAAGIAN